MTVDGRVKVVEKAFPAELGGFIVDFKLVHKKLVDTCPAGESAS